MSTFPEESKIRVMDIMTSTPRAFWSESKIGARAPLAYDDSFQPSGRHLVLCGLHVMQTGSDEFPNVRNGLSQRAFWALGKIDHGVAVEGDTGARQRPGVRESTGEINDIGQRYVRQKFTGQTLKGSPWALDREYPRFTDRVHIGHILEPRRNEIPEATKLLQ